MPDLEDVGEAVTGAMLGRAVEPRTGEIGDGHTHESNCLNCGCALAGDYCQCCGQRAHVHRTLRAFAHDAVHGVVHLEGKTWRTLPLLAWRPGELTRRYIDGERAKFVSPIALFLFSVFLLFAVASITGGLSTGIDNGAMRSELVGEISTVEANLKATQAQRDSALKAGRETAILDKKIDDQQAELAILRGLSGGDFVASRRTVEADDLPGWLRGPVEKIGSNPELTFYKLKTNAYKFSWALIPLSLPFLWLLFPFSRRHRFYDHLIFVTYSLSFMSMLVVLGMVLGSIGLGSLAALLFLVPPFHMYRQLKGTYGLGRGGALVRTLLLATFAFVALALFGIALFAMGLLD